MNVSLETRVPLLDHALFEFVWTLPPAFHAADGPRKRLLKDLLDRYVPRALGRPPEDGLRHPDRTLAARAPARLGRGPARAGAVARQGYLDAGRIAQTWRAYMAGANHLEGPVWTALMFQAWRAEAGAERMRVILVIDSLVGGGAQRQLVNVAIGLHQRGHAVTVFTYFPHDWHLARLTAAGVAHVCHPKRSRFDPAPLRELRRLYRHFKPDVAVAFLRTPAFYAELLRLTDRSVPLIVSERAGVETAGLTAADVAAGLGHLLATHVTANSHDYLDRLARALPLGNRRTVIYNGLQPDFFTRGHDRLGRGPAAPRTAAPDAARKPAAPGMNRPASSPRASRARRGRCRWPGRWRTGPAQQSPPQPAFELDWIGPVDEASALVAEVKRTIEAGGIASRSAVAGPRSARRRRLRPLRRARAAVAVRGRRQYDVRSDGLCRAGDRHRHCRQSAHRP